MKAIKINKDETIRFNGEFVTNGHWLFVPGKNTVSDKSLQALIDAGMKFDRMQYDPRVLTGGESTGFDGERVVPLPTGDDTLLHPTKFTVDLGSYSEMTTCRIFKHVSGRLVAVDVRYDQLWLDRACYQAEPLRAIRIEDNAGLAAVVMPVNPKDLPGEVARLYAGSQPEPKE